MYSAYKLNEQGDNIQPWCLPFPIWNQSIFPCLVLNVASWSGIQISQEEGWVVWYSHLLKNFTQCVVIHTVKDFSIVNEGEVEVFLKLSCFFYNQWILTIWTPLISVVLKLVLSHPWLQVPRLPQCRTGVHAQWTPAESVLGVRCQGTQGQGVTTTLSCSFLHTQCWPFIIHSNWRKSEPARKQTIAHLVALILHSLLNCVNCLYHPIRLSFAWIHLKNKCYHKRDKYPLLRNDDLLYFPSQVIFIRSIDLTRGYWQIQMDDDRKQKITLGCHQGLFILMQCILELLMLQLHLKDEWGAPARFNTSPVWVYLACVLESLLLWV